MKNRHRSAAHAIRVIRAPQVLGRGSIALNVMVSKHEPPKDAKRSMSESYQNLLICKKQCNNMLTVIHDTQ